MLILLVCIVPMAQAEDAPGKAKASFNADEDYLASRNFTGFVDSHPDLRYYRLGLAAYRDAKLDKALHYFRMSARYSDKPAQAMVAEMLWRGEGVEQDRALAYAWMDLAAERGMRRLLVLRERYWEQLDEAERARALEHGERVYAEYGDEVAVSRLERALRREAKRAVGSRTGYVGNGMILAPPPGTYNIEPEVMSSTAFYAATYWDPKQYFAWREQLWERELRQGRVGHAEVGPLQQAGSGDKAD